MDLGESLRKAVEKLRTSSIDKDAIKDAIKELQRALISADVEVALVLELSKKIEQKAFEEPEGKLSRREHVIKVLYDSLAELLGGHKEIPEKPKSILLAGLFGQGKTTTVVKLAHYYAKRGLKVGIIAGDTFRPAAFEQIQQMAEKCQIPYYGNPKEKNAAKVIAEGLKRFEKSDLIIADSAGRDALDAELRTEIKEINNVLKPQHTWLVLGADMGQLAKKQAVAFHDAVGVNGVIITRMDGSAKGGGALSACAVTRAPVYFLGIGEKVNDLEIFEAERYLSRIMGYGDLKGLLEKAAEMDVGEMDIEELMQGEFSLKVFYEQLKAARKMGPLNKVAEMLGFGMQIPKEQLDIGEEKLDGFKVMMDSMTEKEKKNPDLLTHARIIRVAKGSGKKEDDVRELIRHYKQMKNMFKKFKKIDPEKMAKKGFDEKELAKMFGKKKKIKIR